jgi:hypothetical protein
MNTPKNSQFIIASNILYPKKFIILSRKITGSIEETLSKIDTNCFIGQGVVIYSCTIVYFVPGDMDTVVEIELDGKRTFLEIEEILRVFPLIEGEVSEGIYRFYQSELTFYEIKDAFALSKFFNEEPNFDYEAQKLVCSPNGISLQSIKHSEELYFFERFPLTYFDFHCPICQAKIITYEKESSGEIYCSIVYQHCQHFIGNIVAVNGKYDEAALNDFHRNHIFKNGELFLETKNGQWQKTLIVIPQRSTEDSYWNKKKSPQIYMNHFLFLIENEII